MQPISHRRVDRAVLDLGIGYHWSPRIDTRLSIEHENSYGDTIDLPQDFFNADGSLNPDNLYYHDQLAATRYTRASVGVSCRLNDHYRLSADYGRTLAGANSHIWDYESSLGISRIF